MPSSCNGPKPSYLIYRYVQKELVEEERIVRMYVCVYFTAVEHVSTCSTIPYWDKGRQEVSPGCHYLAARFIYI